MLCPVCTDTRLVMTDRAGIEIDYCPNCRGVWLDRGELDKIIERTSAPSLPAPAAAPAPMPVPAPAAPSSLPLPADRPSNSYPAPPPRKYRDDDDDDDDDDDFHRRRRYDGDYSKGEYRPKKRKSLLGEIFDF
jgi:uncharacterized protein